MPRAKKKQSAEAKAALGIESEDLALAGPGSEPKVDFIPTVRDREARTEAGTAEIGPPTLTALELARLSPAGFAEYASGGAWKISKHLAYLNNILLQVATRRITRLIVSMPPRHGKSELISKYLPAWIIGALQQKVIFTAYSSEFASEYGVYARDLILEWGERVFGTKVRSSMAYAAHWETVDGGVMYTVGAGGAITGRGCDWLIIDDPVKNDEEAESATIRAKTAAWFRGTAYTRLEPNAVVIIVMTRWHDEDLVGTLLRTGAGAGTGGAGGGDQGWTVVKLPALAEAGDPIGRAEGEALWPERWPVGALNERRALLTPYQWSAMYQQSPVIVGGNKIQSDWWRYWTLGGGLDDGEVEATVIGWDAATTTREGSSYSCAAVWSKCKDGYYLREVWRDRVEFPDLCKWAHILNERYPGALNIVEDASSGRPLIQVLRAETRYPVFAQTVHVDKVSRLNVVINLIAGGRCFIPRYEDGTVPTWLIDWLDEHNRFPSTTYKDQVDTTSLVLKFFMDGWVHDELPSVRGTVEGEGLGDLLDVFKLET